MGGIEREDKEYKRLRQKRL